MIANAREPNESICIGGIYRLRDDVSGEVIEVRVSVDMAEVLRKLDETAERRERRYRQRMRALGDVAESLTSDAPARRLALRTAASPWEGPRLSFDLLLGLDRIWYGESPSDPCPDCAGGRLDPYTYCLTCDRCGMDSDPRIRPPRHVKEARERARERRRDGLAGGTGGRVKSNGNGKR